VIDQEKMAIELQEVWGRKQYTFLSNNFGLCPVTHFYPMKWNSGRWIANIALGIGKYIVEEATLRFSPRHAHNIQQEYLRFCAEGRKHVFMQ
jgi:hypothetical protein